MRIISLLFTFAALWASTASANAYSWSTQMNCASDYYAYCSKHTAGSPGCHACMRANRPKLSNACVSALIDDDILSKTDSAQQKVKLAETKARPAQSLKVMPVTNPVAKSPVAKALVDKVVATKAATVKRVQSAPLPVANAEPSARPAPAPQAEPVPRPVETALAIDQQTFEAFKSRAPYFLPAIEFEATASNGSPKPMPEAR